MASIRQRISHSAAVIADLTTANPNVYLEVGYALGCNCPTILLIRDPKELKFDVAGQRCLTYKTIRELETRLTEVLTRLREHIRDNRGYHHDNDYAIGAASKRSLRENAAMTQTTPHRHTVFISYSHQDKAWLKRLQVHLKPLERDGLIDRWDDTRITLGSNWRDEITQALAATKVALLLVSADFLASDFIVKNELPPLLVAAQQTGARIFPVIVSPCDYEFSLLEPFQAANDPKKPLNKLAKADREAVLVKITQAIREALPLP